MISVDEARARIVADLAPTGAETVALSEAWDRIAAADIVARVTQPPADLSAMDGYATRAVPAGTRLRVAGVAPAGHPWSGHLGENEALRLFTGSVMPAGADGVLLQEDARLDGDQVTAGEAVTPGRHVRPAGQDFRAGEVLLPAGTRLGARAIGLAASGNHPWLAVHRRPVVGVLATGDEIALPGEPVPPGGIVSSNAHALAALIRARGGVPMVLPIVADDRAAIARAAAEAARFDLLVTTGGVSVGDYDLVQTAFAGRGLAVDFWKVAMRPGKPLMFGRLGDTPVLGLPGNPVSALVCAILFLVPALERLLGLPGEAPPTEPARLGAALAANDARQDHLRASLRHADDTLVATAFTRQDSGMVRLLTMADALIVRPPHAEALQPGMTVPVIRLDRSTA